MASPKKKWLRRKAAEEKAEEEKAVVVPVEVVNVAEEVKEKKPSRRLKLNRNRE